MKTGYKIKKKCGGTHNNMTTKRNHENKADLQKKIKKLCFVIKKNNAFFALRFKKVIEN